MPHTPTDDPFANSDRTVGVHGLLEDATKALKREALLFDQIAIPDLDASNRIFLLRYQIQLPDSLNELFWLRDIGIVRDAPLPLAHTLRREHQNVFAAVTGEPIDMAIPDERMGYEMLLRLFNTAKTRDAVEAFYSRVYSIDLRRDGINAFPILPTRRQIGDVFPSDTTPDTTPVLEVVLKSMPIPDDQTPWEDIIEFRNDPESMKGLRRLRVWTRKFARDTTATSLAEMKEEIDVLLDEYEEHMKLHRMKVNKGATETLITVVGKVAEDFVKLKWGELAKLPFILRERKLSLVEAELKAPNRELAFISMARERFSRSRD